MTPMLGVAPEYTRQLLLEGPVRMKEGREGKVRIPCIEVTEETCKDTGMRGKRAGNRNEGGGLVGKIICSLGMQTWG